MVESTSRLQEEPAPYRFTVKEWHRLGEAGVLDEEARLELLDGEIITMSPIGSRHASAVYNLTDFFGEKNLRRYLIGVGNPIEADRYSEPLPDFMLLPRSQKTAKRHPLTKEAFLVVEVSDSSLAHDRGRKLRKYAKSGVQEYWIVNLQEDVIEVYHSPRGEKYLETSVAKDGDLVAPQAFPDTAVAVSEIIPAR
ncbi:MAG TPA: Uma2 family endonuclease [Chthoniobacter sp.]|jgi:Uma2 family endonuclease